MLAVVGSLAILVAAAAAPAPAGTVTYVTSSEAFLSVGKKSGLAVGQKLNMMRRGRKIGTCDVTEVSDRRAICKGDRIDRGDRFTFAPDASVIPPPKPKELEPKPRPKLPGKKELADKRAAVLAVAVPRVPFERAEAVTTSANATLQLRQQVWTINTAPDGTFARTSIDAAARANLGFGFLPTAYAAAALRVTGDLLAPPDQRFRPGELVELYVWGASVGTSDGPVITEFGRFYPQKAPGLTLLDGAQLGVRFLAETTEVGVYAGAVPDIITTMPSADRLAAGAYMALDLSPTDGFMILPRLRVGVLTTPDFGVLRGEVEAQTQFLFTDAFSFGGSVRAGVGGTPQLVPSLDAGRADVSFTGVTGLALTANYRFLAPLAVDYDLISKVPPVGGAHHASAGAAYRVFSWLTLGGLGGAGFDLLSETVRGYAGPEIGFPELFGSWGGMNLGHLEELGEWPGRSSWVSAQLAPLAVLRLGTRVSYFETEAVGDSLRETAIMIHADAPVLPWLTLRGRAYAQQTLPTLLQSLRSTPTVVMADLSLTGSL